MEVKFSIIVPVYNTGHYLDEALNTLLNQTCTDFEVILINDGSTDSSSDICEQYSTMDNRFKVFHQNN